MQGKSTTNQLGGGNLTMIFHVSKLNQSSHLHSVRMTKGPIKLKTVDSSSTIYDKAKLYSHLARSEYAKLAK